MQLQATGGVTEAMLDDIGALVRCESPSEDQAAVARSAEVVAALGTRLLGIAPEWIVLDGWTHLRWRFGVAPRVLLLGRHDTVWPAELMPSLRPWITIEHMHHGLAAAGEAVLDRLLGMLRGGR